MTSLYTVDPLAHSGSSSVHQHWQSWSRHWNCLICKLPHHLTQFMTSSSGNAAVCCNRTLQMSVASSGHRLGCRSTFTSISTCPCSTVWWVYIQPFLSLSLLCVAFSWLSYFSPWVYTSWCGSLSFFQLGIKTRLQDFYIIYTLQNCKWLSLMWTLLSPHLSVCLLQPL